MGGREAPAARGESPTMRKKSTAGDFRPPSVLETMRFDERKSIGSPHFRQSTLLPRAAMSNTRAMGPSIFQSNNEPEVGLV